MDNYSVGEYIIYRNGDRYELGRIKSLQEDGAFVAYHEGETGAKTPWDCIHKLTNAHCIKDTTLGGECFKQVSTIEPKQGEWIPCSERLPSENGDYLISLDFEWGREVEMGAYIDGEWYNDNRHVNIAWMPLPEPWKGVDDE